MIRCRLMLRCWMVVLDGNTGDAGVLVALDGNTGGAEMVRWCW